MAVEFGGRDDLPGLPSLEMDLTDSETETDSDQGNPITEKRSLKLKPEWSFFSTKPESFAIKKQKPGPKPRKKMNSLIIPGLDEKPKRKKPGPKPKKKAEKSKIRKKPGPKPKKKMQLKKRKVGRPRMLKKRRLLIDDKNELSTKLLKKAKVKPEVPKEELESKISNGNEAGKNAKVVTSNKKLAKKARRNYSKGEGKVLMDRILTEYDLKKNDKVDIDHALIEKLALKHLKQGRTGRRVIMRRLKDRERSWKQGPSTALSALQEKTLSEWILLRHKFKMPVSIEQIALQAKKLSTKMDFVASAK